jgi:hypothetical protein
MEERTVNAVVVWFNQIEQRGMALTIESMPCFFRVTHLRGVGSSDLWPRQVLLVRGFDSDNTGHFVPVEVQWPTREEFNACADDLLGIFDENERQQRVRRIA